MPSNHRLIVAGVRIGGVWRVRVSLWRYLARQLDGGSHR
jgi:hypothetical protein